MAGETPMSALQLIAPAKINWTLEVLHARPDGYHEIRTVLQTIDLADTVTIEPAARLTLELTGEPGPLADEPPERNLAFRAAAAFRARISADAGARITLDKRVPVAAGLGGGSSDAAAVLRGLNELWDARQPKLNLVEIAGEIGSDPPFFVVGGTAFASGRGEIVEALDDAIAQRILLAVPPVERRGEKTAAMFAALDPAHYSEGYGSLGVRDTVAARRPIADAELINAFEAVTGAMQPGTANAMAALRAQGLSPHLCGAGPAFFLLLDASDEITSLSRRIASLGFDTRAARTLSRADATRLTQY